MTGSYCAIADHAPLALNDDSQTGTSTEAKLCEYCGYYDQNWDCNN